MPPFFHHVLVFDVGGSHVSAAVCEQHTYALRGVSRAPLPSDGLNNLPTQAPASSESRPAFRFVRLIHALGERASQSAGIPLSDIAGADLALPGPFDYQNGISQIQHKLRSLYGVDLKAALAARFDWQTNQFGFVNDAAAFLLGEIGAGAAKSFSRSIGITLGTGIGCAFAVDNQIVTQSNTPGSSLQVSGVPPGGEMWNLPYNGVTVEDFVSTRYLRSRYLELTGLEADVSDVAAIAQCKENQPCTALDETIAKQQSATPVKPSTPKSSAASTAARQAFEDFGRHLAMALNQHVAEFQPQVIVLGGGISRASNLFLPTTRKALSFPTRIAISALMDEAPLAGAGVHWFDTVQTQGPR